MADTKVSGLPSIASVAAGDLLVVVDDPAGTPASTKATAQQLAEYVESRAELAELIRDTIGTAATDGTGIDITVDDGANTITVAINTTEEAERIRDVMGTALVAGSNITITPNDGADTITIAGTVDTTAEAERIRDVIGTALVAGSGITVTVNDPSDTITVAVSGGSPTLGLIQAMAYGAYIP